MKGTIKSNSLLTASVVFLSIILFGICFASDKDQFLKDMKAKGVNQLSAGQITELYADSTEYGKNHKSEWEGFYSANGKVKGRAWWSGGEALDEGEWKAINQDLLCFEYFGKWSKNGERCFAVYPSLGEYNYTLIQMTGSPSGGWPDGIIPVKVTRR